MGEYLLGIIMIIIIIIILKLCKTIVHKKENEINRYKCSQLGGECERCDIEVVLYTTKEL
jgi:hypothetical protein